MAYQPSIWAVLAAMALPIFGSAVRADDTAASQSSATTPAPSADSNQGSSTVASVRPTTETFSLDQAVATALSNPSTAFRWKATQDQANQNVSLAQAAFLPQFGSVALVRNQPSNQVIAPGSDQTSISDERARLGLTALYALYDAGQRKDDLKIAQNDDAATTSGIQIDKISVVRSTIDAFFSVLGDQRQYTSSQAQVTAAQEQLRSAQSRLELGLVTKGDVLSAQSALSQALDVADQAAYDLTIAQATLAENMGKDPVVTVPEAEAPPTLQPDYVSVEALTEKALDVSPTLAQLRAQRVAARGRLSVLRAQRTPQVNIRAGAGVADVEQPNTVSVGRGYSYVTLELTAPLFDTERQRALDREQTDKVELADYAITDAENKIKAEALTTATLYQGALSRITAATDAANAADQALSLAEGRYDVGKSPQVDVLTALSVDAQTHTALNAAYDVRDQAVAAILRLTAQTPPFEPAQAAAADTSK